MKTAVVYAGGGAKLAFGVGVRLALEEQGVQPFLETGTSAGALCAAGAAYAGAKGLERLWLSIENWRDVFSVNAGTAVGRSEGFCSLSPIRSLVEKACGGFPHHQAAVCKVRLANKNKEYVCAGDIGFVDSVIASASIPGLCDPVGGCIDGGVRDIVPLRYAIDRGAERIYVVLPDPPETPFDDLWKPSGPWCHAAQNLWRGIDIMTTEILENDVKTCLQKNALPGKRRIEIIVKRPRRAILDTLEFDPDKIRQAIAAGRAA